MTDQTPDQTPTHPHTPADRMRLANERIANAQRRIAELMEQREAATVRRIMAAQKRGSL
jgi:hypothetical protein